MDIKGLETPPEDSKSGEALASLLTRLKTLRGRGGGAGGAAQDAEIAAAFEEACTAVGRNAADVNAALWHQTLVECAKVAPKQPAAFLAMAQLVAELQGARRARLPSHVFHDLTDVLCRSPLAQRPPVVSALASLVLGNVTEVPARVTRLMQVFEAVLESSEAAPESAEGENTSLVALQGMANLCYIEEGTQVSNLNEL